MMQALEGNREVHFTCRKTCASSADGSPTDLASVGRHHLSHEPCEINRHASYARCHAHHFGLFCCAAPSRRKRVAREPRPGRDHRLRPTRSRSKRRPRTLLDSSARRTKADCYADRESPKGFCMIQAQYCIVRKCFVPRWLCGPIAPFFSSEQTFTATGRIGVAQRRDAYSMCESI